FGVGEPGAVMENGRSVLHVAAEIGDLAAGLGLPREAVENALSSALSKLRAVRATRKAPFVDSTVYTSWNAMAVVAYLDAWRAFGWESCRAFALATLDRLWKEARRPGRGIAHGVEQGAPDGLLDDNAQTLLAFTHAYEATGDATHLERAREIADVLWNEFRDAKTGGFFDTLDPDVRALAGVKPIQDAPTPAANSVAALGLARLGHLAGDEAALARAKETLEAFAGRATEYGLFAATHFRAMETIVDEPAKVVVVGEGPNAEALARAALAAWPPGALVLRVRAGGFVPEPARAAASASFDGPRALVCRGASCLPPVGSPTDLLRVLASPRA
ncbi:MAG TPA: thioredoxin domain-containing protein, partial [Candidatus Thermoplasmatota archaeon]|nr:thioredoxin domain-containing protein [Candidatus Thermoplasmatota archaeon]